jgi:hypothetical protein
MTMLHLRKLLAFVFWGLRRVLTAIGGDYGLDWRASTLLVCTEVGLVLCLLGIASIVLGRSFIPASGLRLTYFGVFLVGGVSLLNYYELQYQDKWKQFEREFNGYSRSRKTIGCVVVVMLPILTAAAMSWIGVTLHRLSL